MSWCQDGKEWNGGTEILWSGEGSTIKVGGEKVTAFDHYSEDYETYIFGVHKLLYDWAIANDMHWECHDAGTYFTYKD